MSQSTNIQTRIEQINSRGDVKFLSVVGNYENAQSKVNVKCNTCGHISTRNINKLTTKGNSKLCEGYRYNGCNKCSSISRTAHVGNNSKIVLTKSLDERVAALESKGYKFIRFHEETNSTKIKCELGLSCGHTKIVQYNSAMVSSPHQCNICCYRGVDHSKPCKVYLLQFQHRYTRESFKKVGISNQLIEHRFSAMDEWIISTIHITEDKREICERLERTILSKFSEYRYRRSTQLKCGGYTELLIDSVNVDDIIDLMNQSS